MNRRNEQTSNGSERKDEKPAQHAPGARFWVLLLLLLAVLTAVYFVVII